ncbi:Fc.00g090320.m01.CDS01 [Cosmosporella sp. VM-42]
MGKTVVILGGSLGGMSVTHHLLKYTRPHEEGLKVILVSKNSHFYWNLASVRAVIPGIVKDDQILAPIELGLEQYPPENREFILGAATGIDPTSKTVTVSTDSGDREVTYDYLVLATGANGANDSMPWKASGTHEEILFSLHETSQKVGKAEHVVIAGAGATGVELAGEIQYEYPSKSVILISADKSLVGGDSIAGAVERELVRLGVKMRKGVRVGEAKVRPDGKTEVKLSDGEAIVTDLYLPTMGLRPNTGFLPGEWLNDHRYVDVDEMMRVKGVENVWAAGDVVSKPRASLMNTDAQATCVAKNIDLVLKGKQQQSVKYMRADAFLCSTGRGRGAGRLGYVPVPSLAVWAIKGRTLGMERTPKYVDGSAW